PQRFFDGRDVLPFRLGNPAGVEDGQGPHATRLPVAHALDRIVDRRIDVLAHEVHTHLAAALEGDVRELHAECLFDLNRDDLVFLGGSGAAHRTLTVLALLALPFLDRRQIFAGRLVRRFGVDPEDELVEREPRHRCQVLPVEWDARVQRRREEVRQRDDDRVGVALLALDVQESFGAGAARLVHDDERTRRELVLFGDARDEPGHLIGAASRSGGDDEFDRFGRLPCRDGRRRRRHQRHQNQTHPGRESRALSLHRNSLLETAYSNKAGTDAPSRPAPSLVMDVGIASAYFTSTAALLASRRRNGITAGISHFCHISSTLAWKYPRSSSVKWAKRPCLRRYSRTGLRARPSTRALVLP